MKNVESGDHSSEAAAMIVERRVSRVNERNEMSVHSKDGINTWLTKLDRIGELSATKEGIVFNNLGHIMNLPMLKWLYSSLDGKKAVGVDKITKEQYGANLEKNLQQLLQKIRRGTYKPRPARICEIPKEDGSTRPLAIFVSGQTVQLIVYILSKI